MKQYRVLFGAFIRMYADNTIEAENDEAARQMAIQEFKAKNDELDWYDAQYDNIAQPSIVSIQDTETNGTVLEGFDFPITAADAREYTASKLLTALENLMPDIESEIDQRQHSGNDEEWTELDRKAADARAAIAEATAIKDEPLSGRRAMTPLKKAVTRRSEEVYRDRSKFHRIVVTLYPAGYIGLRLEKCRHEETLSIRAAYETAVQTRVMRKRTERRKSKPCLAKRGRL